MVYRATIFVKIVCADVPRIRSLIIAKTRCQSGSLALMVELRRTNSGRPAQGLATAWRPRIAAGSLGQATSGFNAPFHARARL